MRDTSKSILQISTNPNRNILWSYAVMFDIFKMILVGLDFASTKSKNSFTHSIILVV